MAHQKHREASDHQACTALQMGPKKSEHKRPQENAQASQRLRSADSLRRRVLQKNLQNTILADEALPAVVQVLPGWFCSSCTWPRGVFTMAP